MKITVIVPDDTRSVSMTLIRDIEKQIAIQTGVFEAEDGCVVEYRVPDDEAQPTNETD